MADPHSVLKAPEVRSLPDVWKEAEGNWHRCKTSRHERQEQREELHRFRSSPGAFVCDLISVSLECKSAVAMKNLYKLITAFEWEEHGIEVVEIRNGLRSLRRRLQERAEALEEDLSPLKLRLLMRVATGDVLCELRLSYVTLELFSRRPDVQFLMSCQRGAFLPELSPSASWHQLLRLLGDMEEADGPQSIQRAIGNLEQSFSSSLFELRGSKRLQLCLAEAWRRLDESSAEARKQDVDEELRQERLQWSSWGCSRPSLYVKDEADHVPSEVFSGLPLHQLASQQSMVMTDTLKAQHFSIWATLAEGPLKS